MDAVHEQGQGSSAGTTVTLNKKTMKIVAGVVLVALLSPLFLAALDAYAFAWNNPTLAKVMRALPYPALSVDGKVYTVRELDTELANLERVLIENGNVPPVSEMMKILTDRLVRGAAVSQLLEDRDVDMETALKLAKSMTFGESMTDAQIAEAVKAQFNWDMEYFNQNVLVPYAREMAYAFSVLKPQAEALASEVRAPGADFAEIAKVKGEDASKDAGGDLGWFGKGAMVPEFEAQVWNAEKGAIVGPFVSRFGWHMVKVTDTRGEGDAKEVKASHIIIALKNHEADIEPAITQAAESVKTRVFVRK